MDTKGSLKRRLHFLTFAADHVFFPVHHDRHPLFEKVRSLVGLHHLVGFEVPDAGLGDFLCRVGRF